MLVALAGAAALNRPTAGLADVLPALVAGVVGVAALAWLVRSTPVEEPSGRRSPGPAASRRGVLIGVGVLDRGRRGDGWRRSPDRAAPAA